MTDVKVEQCDYDMAKPFFNEGGPAFPMLAEAFARHRQAAEKAQQERDAGIAEHLAFGCEVTTTDDLGWPTTVAGAAKHQSDAIATAIRSQGHE